MIADAVPVAARVRALPGLGLRTGRLAAMALGASLFWWGHLTIARQFPGSSAVHDLNLYAAPVVGVLIAALSWRRVVPARPRLVIAGGLLWLAAGLATSWGARDPALALVWVAYLAAALCLLLTGVERAGLAAGLALGVAVSLPVMIFQAVAQTSWPAATIQGWYGGELTGAVRGAAVLGAGRWLRPYGLMPHPNIAGGLAAIACVLLASEWIRQRRPWQLLTASAGFTEALLSFSRSAWLGALLGLAALAILHRDRLRPLLLAAGLPALLFAVTLGGLALQRAEDAGQLQSDSVSQRFYLVHTALHFWRQRPLLGIGPAQFSQWEVDAYGPSFIPEPAHNAVLLVLAESGLVGLAGAGLVVLGVARQACRRRDEAVLAVGLAALSPLMLDHYLMTVGVGLTLLAAVLSPAEEG